MGQAKHNYEIAPDESWIRCGNCAFVSYNPNDVKMKYCGHCHAWLSKGNCDFCSGEYDTFRDYQAIERFKGIMTDGRLVEDGDLLWAACRDCEALIEAGEWESLIERALLGMDAKGGMRATVLRAKIIWMYQQVFGEKFTVIK